MKFLKTTILTIALLFGAMSFALAQHHHGDTPNDFPDNVDTADCTALPPAKAFDIKVKWKSDKNTSSEANANGVSTPLVADLDGDGNVEVIGTWGAKNPNEEQYPRIMGYITHDLVVFDGKTGDFKYKIKTCDFQNMGQTVAIADVDMDGKCEIFIVAIGDKVSGCNYKGKYVYCYDGSKANSSANDYKWKSKNELEHIFTPLVADLNNDGIPELVCGGTVFNAVTGDRILVGSMASTGMGFGDPHCVNGSWNVSKAGYLGEPYYFCAVADIDGDNQLEVCAGNKVYKPEITNTTGVSGNKWKVFQTGEDGLPTGYKNVYDGQTFVLDFDNDGDLDVCVLSQRTDQYSSGIFASGQNQIGLYVWDGQTPEMIGYFMCDPKTFSLSVPFAADIDGDGFAEVIANGWIYGYYWNKDEKYPDMMHVWRYQKGATSKSGEAEKYKNIIQVFNRNQAKEFSESAGFTVFDFNQDGKSEIVYRGTDFLYILDGTTLTKLCTPQNVQSGTLGEYPIVADVDCDGHADIIITDVLTKRTDTKNGQAGKITVYESKTPGAWGPARKVWNQFPYNVVNINEDMTVPKYQFDMTHVFPNGHKPFNAFLKQQTMLNREGEMYAPAANAHIMSDSTALKIHCDSITIDIDFTNTGTEALYAPYGLTIYKDDYKGSVIYQKTYNSDLAVDDVLHLHLKYMEDDLAQWMPITNFYVTINDIGTGIAEEGGQQHECDTTNNRLILPFEGFSHTEYDTVTHHMCVGETYEIGTSIYTQSGEYIDTLQNRFGCDSIITSYVYTHEIHVDLGEDQSFCQKDYNPVTLDAGAGEIVPSRYEWQDGSSNRTFTVFDGGVYNVKVFDEYNCVDSDSVEIIITENPEVYITKSTEDFCSSGVVVLTANSSVDNVNYQWNTNETSQSISVVYAGTYTVIVANADDERCTGKASIQIPICPCEVWVPNAFSPNNDGVNDVFKPEISNNLLSYQIYIYDRWGEQIFTATDPNIVWDGKVKGDRVAAGVFTYVIFYTCSNAPDNPLEKHGSITVVR